MPMHAVETLEKLLEVLENKEELHWHQRSRAHWLQAGDKNISWLHSRASARKRRNLIPGLMNFHGDWSTSDAATANIVVRYFSDIFQSSNPHAIDIDLVLHAVETRVTVDMNDLLLKPYTPDEIVSTLMDIHPIKAPGPDGFPALFFQKSWVLLATLLPSTFFKF